MEPKRYPCIYCKESKAGCDFSSEHVIPRAFGKFECNIVLRCVCRDCNEGLGRDVDAALASDTPEGLLRFIHGLKPAEAYSSLGRQQLSRTEFSLDGPMHGAPGKLVCTEGELRVQPRPSVGFAVAGSDQFRWFKAEDLPSKEALGFPRGQPIDIRIPPGLGPGEADSIRQSLLHAGFALDSAETTEVPAPTGKTRVDHVFRYDSVRLRAIAKVAFGYLAHIAGAAVVMMPCFDDVRALIRYGSGRAVDRVRLLPPMHVSREDGSAIVGHFIAVDHRDGSVVGQVSLLSQVRFGIFLGKTSTPIKPSCHIFDCRTRQIHTADVPEWDGGEYAP